MVYHYTNLVMETNAWWVRRVRPAWATFLLVTGGFCYYRYKMMGKLAVIREARMTPEERKKVAELNKRPWGFDNTYKPTLEISLKKKLREELGGKFIRKLQTCFQTRRKILYRCERQRSCLARRRSLQSLTKSLFIDTNKLLPFSHARFTISF